MSRCYYCYWDKLLYSFATCHKQHHVFDVCISCVHTAWPYRSLQERFLINKLSYHPHMFAPSHVVLTQDPHPCRDTADSLYKRQSSQIIPHLGLVVGCVGRNDWQCPSLLKPSETHQLAVSSPLHLPSFNWETHPVAGRSHLQSDSSSCDRGSNWEGSCYQAKLRDCSLATMLLHSTADKICNHTVSKIPIPSTVKTCQNCRNTHKLPWFWLCASNRLATTTPCPGRAFVRGRTWVLCTSCKCLEVEPDSDLLAPGCMDVWSVQTRIALILNVFYILSSNSVRWSKKLCPLSFQNVLWIQDPWQNKRIPVKSKQAYSCHSQTKWIYVTNVTNIDLDML